tara:strand:- start:7816 stop:8088 length:273 start_codon:yes stop_codon:yes gene_type:complete
MRMRKLFWRNRAYDYIKLNGPTSSSELLEMVMQKNGRPFGIKGPAHINGTAQLMRVDKRFKGTLVSSKIIGQYAANTYDVMQWELNDDEE